MEGINLKSFIENRMKKRDPEKEIQEAMETKKQENQETERKMNEVWKKMEELRKKDFEFVNFENIKALSKTLGKMDFFEKIIAIEKGIRTGKADAAKLKEILSKTDDDYIRLAVIENLPNFKNSKEAIICMEILREYATSPKTRNCLRGERGYIKEKSQDEIENFHISQYRINYNNEASFDILRSASIKNLSEFGLQSERHLIGAFSRKKEYGQIRRDAKEEADRKDKTFEFEEIGDLDFSTDEHGHLNDEEVKFEADTEYSYNALILEKLILMQGEKSVNFAIDLVFEDSDSVFIYKDQIEAILKNSSEYSAEKIFEKLEDNKYARDTAKDIVLLACDLVGIDVVKKRIEKFASDEQQKEIDYLYSILKVSREKRNSVSLETIRNLNFYTSEIGEDLNEKEKKEILEISRKNYFEVVFPNEPEKARVVVEGLEKELYPEKFPNKKTENVKNQKTYTLKYKGSIIAFCKFKQVSGKPDELEFTSVNISPELHGLNIGEYFISKVLDAESKNHIINGESFAKNTAANKLYFEKVGFKNTGEYESEKYLGERLYKMRMEKREK